MSEIDFSPGDNPSAPAGEFPGDISRLIFPSDPRWPIHPSGHGWTSASGYHLGVSRMTGQRVSVHTLVWELFNGPLPAGWVIHHRNRQRQDNRLVNLLAMPRQDHSALHRGFTVNDAGLWVGVCRSCGRELPRSPGYWRFDAERGSVLQTCLDCVRARRRAA